MYKLNEINKKVGVTDDEYRLWCKKENLPHYKLTTKKRFYRLILNKEIVRDSKTGKLKLVKKKKKKII